MNYTKESKIESLYQKTIKSLMILVISYLTFSSIVKTYYYGHDEIATVIKDNWLKNIAFIAVVIFIFYLLQYVKNIICTTNYHHVDKIFKYTRIVLFLLLGFAAIFWVFYSNITYLPGDDSWFCFSSAGEFRNGDYSSLQPGGYLNRCINNLGFVWFIRTLMILFDKNIIIGFYIINALSLPVFYYFLARVVWSPNYHISRNLFISCVYILGIVFTPLIYLCTRFYGNVLGLCFAIGAIFFELRYFSSYRISDLLLSALFILISIVLKSNHAIFAIAMILLALVKMIRTWSSCKKQKQFLSMLYIVILFANIFASSKLINAFTEKITGQNLDDVGYSYYAHVAMGLQDKGDINSPGWWNSYNNDTYEESGFSTNAHKQMALESIQESLSAFSANPRSILSFLERKINSQWNCPEFQMDYYIIQPFTESHPNIDNFEPARHWTEYQQSEFLNLFHSIILFGSLIYLLLFFQTNDNSTVLLLTFLGGFIFHIVWEAKAVYAISYFVLLFPFAIIGYKTLGEIIFHRVYHKTASINSQS